MYMWRELDLAEVRDELAQIADIGIDTVRLFALTRDFLPRPGFVDPDMVARLVEVAGAVKEAGLRIVPTLVVLNMSGRIWWPEWMVNAQGRPADLFSDPFVMHAYPLYSSAARSFLDPELVPFSCALTAGLSGKGRPPLMQEFGLCTTPPGVAGHSFTDDFLGEPKSQYLASEEEGAAYYQSVMSRLVAAGAAGAYAWCYCDYDARLFARPPLTTAVRERTFGLVRSDGTEKPAAGVFRELRKRREAGGLARGSVPGVLDVSADEYYRSPAAHFERLYARWVLAHS